MRSLFTLLPAVTVLPALPVLANNIDNTSTAKPEVITVTGVRQRLEQAGSLANTIIKTEVIGEQRIARQNAVNLTEAIDSSPGVKVSNECSMCGVKRIMLNGMKGEQTTLLVDGLPVHTMISGYYAVDAIPTTGISRIEVARGAGASLIAPEAIGGTINIVSLTPYDNGASLELASGSDGYRKLALLGKGVSDNGRTRGTLVAQYDNRDQVDKDHNNVNEAPQQSNRTLVARVSHDIGDFDNIIVRVANTESEIFGGPMLGRTFADGQAASIGSVLASFDDQASAPSQLFADGDVRHRYIGKAWETTEWIKTQRNEASLALLKEINSRWNLHLAVSYADHNQDSFYEGFDYSAKDYMLFFDARANYVASDQHLLTFGADRRDERMRSFSKAGSANPDYVSDAFNYVVNGLYGQDTWHPNAALEVAMALRIDQITADFIDPAKPGVELTKTIVSPRIDLRYHHTPLWTSRLSLGRGYRAPLSFFETDHGILDSALGFHIDIHDVERSDSVTYSLNYQSQRLTATAAVAWTAVDNLAALTADANGVPLLHQLNKRGSVVTTDIAIGYDLGNGLSANLTAEHFDHSQVFKSSYAIAPVENRINASLDWDIAGWDLYASWSWVGARDLAQYGYDGYNRIFSDGNVDPASKKTLDAPAYSTVDVRAAYQLNDTAELYVGATNLFDHTQAGDEDSPLFYGPAGGFDVAYIYGPLRGREVYAGLKISF